MQVIRSRYRQNRFIQVPKGIWNMGLSDGAISLYSYLCGLVEKDYSDTYLAKALGKSEPTIRRLRKELEDVQLVLSERVGPKAYRLFIGRPDLSPYKVKREWEERNALQE